MATALLLFLHYFFIGDAGMGAARSGSPQTVRRAGGRAVRGVSRTGGRASISPNLACLWLLARRPAPLRAGC